MSVMSAMSAMQMSPSGDDSISPSQQGMPGSRRAAPVPLDSMRAYRACLNCRGRKTRCDLDINGGRPPCRRCQREQKECVLGESHRGGRRVRKKPKIEGDGPPPPPPPESSGQSSTNSPTEHTPTGYAPSGHTPTIDYQPRMKLDTPFLKRQEPATGQFAWQGQASTPIPDGIQHQLRINNMVTIPRTIIPDVSDETKTTGSEVFTRSKSASDLPTSGGRPVHESIASADLQNPSDALEILAQVADRAEDGDSASSDNGMIKVSRNHDPRMAPIAHMNNFFQYKPLNDGLISPDMIYNLFANYATNYHPFFPIVNRESFDPQKLPQLSRKEPHLFSAVLAIGSKDDMKIHRICFDHMQQLISDIIAGSDAGVEAVEALLILSHWVSHRPQANVTVGRGEEDRQAWMYIGTAVRLGYFLGIDRTAFKTDQVEHTPQFIRSKLAWVACYVCDRSVAVRLGKGFWARGPGPLSGLKAKDFPSLAPRSENEDDHAAFFQAHLELIQIFSNVHDILYSSKGHGWKEMLEGRYAKYLDDFRSTIRSWHDTWGDLACSPRLRTSNKLSYDYLRLYVNAFAYQATISRAMMVSRDSQQSQVSPLPLINAAAPDARFIYDAINAAKSLLSTFNSFESPESLRYMPSKYFLYIIYSAVFLYKARSTTTMTDDERLGLRKIVNVTIERLQKTSAGANHMGERYARLIHLLWRKSPKKPSDPRGITPQSIDGHLSANDAFQNMQGNGNQQYSFDATATQNGAYHDMPVYNNHGLQPPPGNGTFSWLDLGATWSFATQNNSVNGSIGDMDLSDELEGTGIPSPYDLDMSLLSDYRLLDGDNPNLIF